MMIFMNMFMFLYLIVSADNFWFVWIILEMFTLSLTSFLILHKSKKNSQGVMSYYLTQIVGSIIFFISVFLNFQTDCFEMKLFLMHISLFSKLGAFPFHSWTISFVESLTWKNVAVSMSTPKMILTWPFFLLFPFFFKLDFFVFSFLGGVLVPLKNLKSSSLKAIIAYTTIVHTAWMLMCCIISQKACFFYFFFYLVTLFPLCFFLNYYKLNSYKDLLFYNSFIPLFCLATFTGIPPLLGFLPKLKIIISFLDFKFVFEAAILGISSIFPIYLYIKLFFFTLLKSKSSKDLQIFKKKFFNLYLFCLFTTVLFNLSYFF